MKTEKNIFIAFLLNLLFSLIELIGGIITNSIAIISDSIHDMGDTLSIGVSYFLEKKSKQKPNDKYTYGYIRYSVLGSLITIVILLSGSILVIYNAILRIFNPVNINYSGMILLAIIGAIINLLAAYYTKDGESLNQKSINLHMIEDVLGWIIVLIGAIIMKYTDIKIIDSILSIGVSLFIFINAFKTLKEIIDIFLEKTPKNINVNELKEHILNIKDVIDIHHIHIRSIDGFNNYGTMHIVVNKYTKEIKHKIKEELEEHGISHTTIEFEEKDEKCEQEECIIEHNHHNHHHHHKH